MPSGIDSRSEGELDEVKSGVYRLTFRGCICAPVAPVAQFTSIKMLTQTKNLTKEVGMIVNSAVAATTVERATLRLIYRLLCQKILILQKFCSSTTAYVYILTCILRGLTIITFYILLRQFIRVLWTHGVPPYHCAIICDTGILKGKMNF